MVNAYSNRSRKSIFGAISKAACIAKKDAKIYYFKPQILGFGILIPAFVYLSFSLGREMHPGSADPRTRWHGLPIRSVFRRGDIHYD